MAEQLRNFPEQQLAGVCVSPTGELQIHCFRDYLFVDNTFIYLNRFNINISSDLLQEIGSTLHGRIAWVSMHTADSSRPLYDFVNIIVPSENGPVNYPFMTSGVRG